MNPLILFLQMHGLDRRTDRKKTVNPYRGKDGNMKMMNVKLLDCTLRDGGYINQWHFGKSTIMGILERLSLAEMDFIECGFLTEKAKTEEDTLFLDGKEIDSYIKTPNPNAVYVAMIAIGEKEIHPDKLCDAKDTFLGGVRLTFHKNEIKKAFEWAGILKKKGYLVFMQPVGSANYDDNTLLELMKKVNHLKPYAFYIVDTLGAMSTKDMMHMLHIIDKNLDEEIALGYHSHNNLQLAFANAQNMVEFGLKREVIIDCSVYGMGRGAGNLCTELMLEYMQRKGEKKYDVLPILEIVDNYLLPIYLEHPWGYSIAYFLSSAVKCHPNYISYFFGKQNIQVRTIGNLLTQIPPEYRLVYHPEIIEEIYQNYQNNAIDDLEELHQLKRQWKGKNILVLAPGRSIHSKHKAIQKYIEKQKPYVISINFLPDFPVDMLFVANQKRYEAMKDKVEYSRTVFTSNITNLPENEEIRMVNYSTLLNNGKDVSDSTGLMLFRLLVKAKVKKVNVAGLDEFKMNYLSNYCEKRYLYQEDDKTIRRKNKQMREQMKLLRKEIDIQFITPSKYDE